jgi:hypothetical protein
MKGKRLGNLLHTARATPRRGRGLSWGGNPERRDGVVGRLLRNRRESDAPRDTTTLCQREPRCLVSLVCGHDLPQGGGLRGKRKRRWAWKHQRDLGERKITGLDRQIRSNWSSPHCARSGKRLVLGRRRRRGRRLLEGDAIVHAIVVVPPFADTRSSEPSNEEDVELGEPLFVKVEVDDKTETIPLELLRTTLTAGKLSNCISDGPRPREGRRELGEGVGVLAQDL